MSTNATVNDYLNHLRRKIDEQATAGDDSEKKAIAKVETSKSLSDLLQCISQAPKEDLSENARSELDTAIIAHSTALKWPLINALKILPLYRSFLGLPQTMEQTRRFLTTVSSKKMDEIMEGLDKSIECDCQDASQLQWVEQVLINMTGAGKFKKELCGFELKSPNKQKVKTVINQVKKRRAEMEKVAADKLKPDKKPKALQADCFIDRDFRVTDSEREAARMSDFKSMVDKAVSKAKR